LVGHIARMKGTRNAYRILVVIPKGRRPLGRPKSIREDSIRIDVRWEGVDWIHLAQDRDQWRTFVGTVMNHRFP